MDDTHSSVGTDRDERGESDDDIALAAKERIGGHFPCPSEVLAACLGLRLEPVGSSFDTSAIDSGYAGSVAYDRADSQADARIALACARYVVSIAGGDELDADLVASVALELCGVDVRDLARTSTFMPLRSCAAIRKRKAV